MPQNQSDTNVLVVSALPTRRPTPFSLVPDSDARNAIAAELGLLGLRKLSFSGEVAPDGQRDWALAATLGATVVQPCVVTLDPVTTRIDIPVTRRFIDGLSYGDTPDEVEMPEDDTQEPLGAEIDLAALMTEALALALPDYPRSGSVEFDSAQATPPGAAPISDAETKPFAGLAALKDKLDNGD